MLKYIDGFTFHMPKAHLERTKSFAFVAPLTNPDILIFDDARMLYGGFKSIMLVAE